MKWCLAIAIVNAVVVAYMRLRRRHRNEPSACPPHNRTWLFLDNADGDAPRPTWEDLH